ncbi:hypothetical protein [Streptomyces sp. KL116D]|uniref:hypothetical protein n=1 Tax=Streptomyces sp. KL116D TaxID=3045152 RepID=UPI003557CC6C
MRWRDTGVTLRVRPVAGRTRTPRCGSPSPASAARFRLKVRVPGWLADADRPRPPRVTVSGRAVDTSDAAPGTYLTLDRHWSAGDTVELTFPRTPVAATRPRQPARAGPHPRAAGPRRGVRHRHVTHDPHPRPRLRTASRPGRTEFTAVQADGTEISLRPLPRRSTTSTTTSTSRRRHGRGAPARPPATSSPRAPAPRSPTARSHPTDCSPAAPAGPRAAADAPRRSPSAAPAATSRCRPA